MKILFGATPVPGHLLPLLPLADAAADAGHDVAFLTAASMAPFLSGRQLLAAGPDFDRIVAVNERRVGDARNFGIAAAELFAGTRVDLTWEDALQQARHHQPDLLVGEWVDFVTPLLAARLDVPWAAHSIGGPLPMEFADALHERANWQHAFRFLKPRDRIALLDPFPDSLRLPEDTPPESDRITIRPGRVTEPAARPIPQRPASMPRALVTLGTSVGDPELMAAIAQSVADAGFDVLATTSPERLRTGPRMHAVGFTSLPELLADVDVVIGAAGAGTLLATLAAGVPTVLFPVLADQPLNAARAVRRGVAVTIREPNQAGPAAGRILGDPKYRRAAGAMATEMAAMNSAEQALAELGYGSISQ